jgi:hypothetical protein
MNDPRTLWAADDAHLPPLDPARLRQRSDALHRRVKRRNAIEYAAAAAIAPIFGWVGWTVGDTLLAIACAAVIAGTALIVFNLWRRRSREMPAAMAVPALAFHRDQLVRQRDALAGVWRWYLAPLVPGMALFLAAIYRMLRTTMPAGTAIVGIAPSATVIVAIFVAIHFVNRAASRRLDREIAALDAQNQED